MKKNISELKRTSIAKRLNREISYLQQLLGIKNRGELESIIDKKYGKTFYFRVTGLMYDYSTMEDLTSFIDILIKIRKENLKDVSNEA